MHKRNATARVTLTSMIALAAGLVPATAYAQNAAQDQAPPQDRQDASADTGDIIVTGSRIARPNLDSVSPVTSITAAEIQQTGNISTGDVLNNLPALASTYSQANSTRFLGTAGLNLLDLRNLGPQRTLVLVNGRRHVAADILNNAVSPDVNTFPTDLIERVDVVTGGDSAIYGSDAIAGVVNFVLKDKFEGVQLHAQGGLSQFGDAGSYYASVLAGKNFAGGRGNVAIDIEYARQNDLYASGRDYLSHVDGLVGVDVDPAGIANGSDGNPDSVFFHDVRSATIYSGGLVSFYSPAGACGRDTQLDAAGRGRAYTCNYLFTPDGRLVAETGTRVGLQTPPAAIPTSPTGVTAAGPGGNFIGGNGNTRREGRLTQILPQLDRYSANLIAHFDVSSAFVPFVEAKYVRTDSFGAGANGPAFITGTTLDGVYERPRLDNPFLSQQARDTITAQMIAGGADPASITDSTRFVLRKNLTDLGVRSEEARRETYRLVVGARGEIADGWRYEASANYGEFHERTKVLGNLNVQRFLLAMDSTRNAAGQIVCRGVTDPAFGGDIAGNPAVLAADMAACVPINPFGDGNVSQAAKDYVLQDTVSIGKISQFVGSGFVSGDTRNFFNLPGGPVGVAVGAEYRRETAFYEQDALVSAGYTFYNSIPKFAPPAFEVKEAYVEVRLPVLANLPFIRELTASGAFRIADYKGATGSVKSYNAGLEYAPIKGIRFRANYSRAVRAPNLVDLYQPLGQNFAGGFADPCSADNLGRGTQYRTANCATSGRPSDYNYAYVQSLQIQSGGNPDLKAETSNSYTYGVVLQPDFVPGLAMTVDYYNVAVNGVITTPSAQQIVNSCYDSPTLQNQFCGLFQRAGAAGGPAGEQQFRILEGSLQQVLLNYAKFQARGIDFDIAYNRDVGFGNISTHFIWTHSLQEDQLLDPSQPGFANRLLSELGQPKDAFNWSVGLDTGPFSFNYQMRYLSPMAVSVYEDTNAFQGRPPQNADFSEPARYPSVFYHDIRLGIEARKGMHLYLGIDNLTDARPPLGSTGIGGGSGIYEPIGRRFYAGATAKF
jgi:outer membrane receptor protein involved in Fe transport